VLLALSNRSFTPFGAVSCFISELSSKSDGHSVALPLGHHRHAIVRSCWSRRWPRPWSADAREGVSQGRCLVPWIFVYRMTASAPAQNRERRYRSPSFVMLPSFSLPPLELCFGTSPTQPEKSRPDRKTLGSVTLATSAVASAGPTPGVASSRLQVSFERCNVFSHRSRIRM